MRTATTKRSFKNRMASRRVKQTRPNGNQESELQVSNRPQFRASNIMAHALALYNLETAHTVSQTMNMALRQFIPTKYVTQAEQLLRNGNSVNLEDIDKTPKISANFCVTSDRISDTTSVMTRCDALSVTASKQTTQQERKTSHAV